MKTISIIFIFLSNLVYAQNDSISIAEVNDMLNLCYENLDEDSVVSSLESRAGMDLCTLIGNLQLYSFQKSVNLSHEEIKAIENRTILITLEFFKEGSPIKIFKEGGVESGGKIRLEKSELDGIILNSIFLSTTDVKFENDVLEDKLIAIINHKTEELIKGRVQKK
ncbi:MAG: hypothetical protein RQ875_13015 [Vicingaceae bacterium]|nr:hypothetical protein [Vicingaceae bacterium]